MRVLVSYHLVGASESHHRCYQKSVEEIQENLEEPKVLVKPEDLEKPKNSCSSQNRIITFNYDILLDHH